MSPVIAEQLARRGGLSGSAERLSRNLRIQWSNPRDVLSLLLLIGGDVVQRAIAQLSGPRIVPVCFSFGWVAYAFSALLSTAGDNRLIPDPDFPAIVINAKNGSTRQNQSWVIGRIVRDINEWMDQEPKAKLAAIIANAQNAENERVRKINARSKEGPAKEGHREETPQKILRKGLCVSVYESVGGRSPFSFHTDFVWWSGIPVTVFQLGVAAIPCGLYAQWEILVITACGTILAYVMAMLPQWSREKWACRRFTEDSKPKTVALLRGNGAQQVIIIHSDKTGLDFEDLAAVEPVSHTFTILTTGILAVFWTALLVTVSGIQYNTWYLVAVGGAGMLHNIFVAGASRHPKDFGVSLRYRQCSVRPKVMASLMEVELICQDLFNVADVGRALLPEYFSGSFRQTEIDWWSLSHELQRSLYNQGFLEQDEEGKRQMLLQLSTSQTSGGMAEQSHVPIISGPNAPADTSIFQGSGVT